MHSFPGSTTFTGPWSCPDGGDRASCLSSRERLDLIGRVYSVMPRPSYQWRVVGILWCISFFNYADRQAIFSVFPLLEREMQLTPVQLGLVLFVNRDVARMQEGT